MPDMSVMRAASSTTIAALLHTRNVKFHTMAHAGRGMWVDIIVLTAIRAGDEILVDYGADFASYASDAHTTPSRRALKVARKRPLPGERYERS